MIIELKINPKTTLQFEIKSESEIETKCKELSIRYKLSRDIGKKLAEYIRNYIKIECMKENQKEKVQINKSLERLYSKGIQNRKEKQEKERTLKQNKANDSLNNEMRSCTFTPMINEKVINYTDKIFNFHPENKLYYEDISKRSKSKLNNEITKYEKSEVNDIYNKINKSNKEKLKSISKVVKSDNQLEENQVITENRVIQNEKNDKSRNTKTSKHNYIIQQNTDKENNNTLNKSIIKTNDTSLFKNTMKNKNTSNINSLLNSSNSIPAFTFASINKDKDKTTLMNSNKSLLDCNFNNHLYNNYIFKKEKVMIAPKPIQLKSIKSVSSISEYLLSNKNEDPNIVINSINEKEKNKKGSKSKNFLSKTKNNSPKEENNSIIPISPITKNEISSHMNINKLIIKNNQLSKSNKKITLKSKSQSQSQEKFKTSTTFNIINSNYIKKESSSNTNNSFLNGIHFHQSRNKTKNSLFNMNSNSLKETSKIFASYTIESKSKHKKDLKIGISNESIIGNNTLSTVLKSPLVSHLKEEGKRNEYNNSSSNVSERENQNHRLLILKDFNSFKLPSNRESLTLRVNNGVINKNKDSYKKNSEKNQYSNNKNSILCNRNLFRSNDESSLINSTKNINDEKKRKYNENITILKKFDVNNSRNMKFNNSLYINSTNNSYINNTIGNYKKLNTTKNIQTIETINETINRLSKPKYKIEEKEKKDIRKAFKFNISSSRINKNHDSNSKVERKKSNESKKEKKYFKSNSNKQNNLFSKYNTLTNSKIMEDYKKQKKTQFDKERKSIEKKISSFEYKKLKDLFELIFSKCKKFNDIYKIEEYGVSIEIKDRLIIPVLVYLKKNKLKFDFSNFYSIGKKILENLI